MPLLTLHTTGDGQVPIEQARILQRRVDAAGRDRLLVQRVFRDPGHCGFTSTEWAAALRGARPVGRARRAAHRATTCRPGAWTTSAAVRAAPAARNAGGRRGPRRAPARACCTGGSRSTARRSTRAGWARWCGGATGWSRPASSALSPVRRGRYSITVMAERGGERLRRAGRADRALDVRRRSDPLQPRAAAMAATRPRALRRLVLEREPRMAPCRPGRSSPATCSRPTAAQLPGRDAHRGVRRHHALRRHVGAPHRKLLRLQPRRRRAPTRSPGVPGGATITFRVNGRRALDTAVNRPGTLGHSGPDGARPRGLTGHELEQRATQALSLRRLSPRQ